MGKAGVPIAIVGLVIGVAGVIGYGTYSSASVDQTKIIQAKDIQNIQVDSRISGVHIYPSKSDDITVHLQGNSNQNDLVLTAEANGNTATIEYRHKNTVTFNLNPFAFFTNRMQVEVEIPQKVYKQLKINSSAGGIAMEQVSADRFDLHSSAGGIDVKDLKGDVTAHSSAGSIKVLNVDGMLNVTDSAGSIDVDLQEIKHDIIANDSAGSITITTQVQPAALRFNLSTSAGHASVNVPNALFTTKERDHTVGTIGSGGPMVQLKSSAGSVSINE